MVPPEPTISTPPLNGVTAPGPLKALLGRNTVPPLNVVVGDANPTVLAGKFPCRSELPPIKRMKPPVNGFGVPPVAKFEGRVGAPYEPALFVVSGTATGKRIRTPVPTLLRRIRKRVAKSAKPNPVAPSKAVCGCNPDSVL